MKVERMLDNISRCDSDLIINIVFNSVVYQYIDIYADNGEVYIEAYASDSNGKDTYTVQEFRDVLNGMDMNAQMVLFADGHYTGTIQLYADADYLYFEGNSMDGMVPNTWTYASVNPKGVNTMNIKHNRKGIKADFRDNTIDKDAVRELVLVITNDGDQYRRQITPAIENLKKKYKKGTYDRDLAVKLWQYVADEGVRRYNKEYGSGTYSVAWLNPATRKAIAEELRDYYEDEIMYEEPVNASTRRRPIKAAKDISYVMHNYMNGSGFALEQDLGNDKYVVSYQGTPVTIEFDPSFPEYVYDINGEGPYSHNSYEYIYDDIREWVDAHTDEWGNVIASTIRSNRRPIKAAEGLNGMKIIVQSKAYVDITRDDYEQGALDYVNQWDFDVRGEYDDIQSLIDKISVESYVFSSMLSDYYFLDGALHTSATVNNDNEIPTESEIELWKRGEENLYIADLYLPLSVGSVHDMTEDEASAFGLDIY